MLQTYTCPPDDFLAKSRIPVRIQPDESAIYEEMAWTMVDIIQKARGKRVVIICPVGPIGQYPVFARMVNELHLPLHNTYFINMDEYLIGQDQMISPDHPLSFQGIMDKLVYRQISPDLCMPPEQRIFPLPGKETDIDRLIADFGPPDCCLTGVGINGHIAFNEPPEDETQHTVATFAELPTRCLDLSRETIINNGANKLHGAIDLMPRRCITLGMKQLLACKTIKIYLYCGWQWGIMRKIALEPSTPLAPASLLQNHPDSEMVITKALYEQTLF